MLRSMDEMSYFLVLGGKRDAAILESKTAGAVFMRYHPKPGDLKIGYLDKAGFVIAGDQIKLDRLIYASNPIDRGRALSYPEDSLKEYTPKAISNYIDYVVENWQKDDNLKWMAFIHHIPKIENGKVSNSSIDLGLKYRNFFLDQLNNPESILANNPNFINNIENDFIRYIKSGNLEYKIQEGEWGK